MVHFKKLPWLYPVLFATRFYNRKHLLFLLIGPKRGLRFSSVRPSITIGRVGWTVLYN
jgi:hypothetical protein